MLEGKRMIMKFRSVRGQQVPFHKAMHHLHRPKDLEDKCLCELWRDVEFKPASSITEGEEHFDFIKDHPLHMREVVVHRKHPCVPVFAWNWLSHTGKFHDSVLHPTTPGGRDHHEREEHCKRFMMLFFPFRKLEDLLLEGSHQKALAKAIHEGRVEKQMMEIANNIQDIHNSLQSELVDDPLVCQTIMEEGESSEELEDPDECNCQDLLDSIGECFASTSRGPPLKDDATTLNPTFISQEHESGKKAFPQTNTDKIVLKNVFHHAPNNSKTKKNPKRKSDDRQIANVSELNTLALHAIIPTDSHTNEGPPALLPRTTRPKAAGTWESVVAWGQMARLDAEQQTAFQIMVATFVLSFCQEAKGMPNQDRQTHLHQTECLRKLARKQENNHDPLRMFITGPAGAGKCKWCIQVTNAESA